MDTILKMAFFILIFSFSSLNAQGFINFKAISWDWITVGILAVLFLLLTLSIIREIRVNRKKINNFFIKEKCKTNYNNTYLNDINNTRVKSNSKLKETILNLSKDDTTILKDLKKVYKDIFLTNKEESIFLSIATQNPIGSLETFNSKELFSELYEYDIINKTDKIVNNKHSLVANKEIILDIFLLLSNLQTKEHNFSKPKFNIDIDESKNMLIININRKLNLNKYIQNVFNNNLTPEYDSKSKKYYGIYLYLLKHLANRINAILRVNSQENSYKVSIEIPIDIKFESKTPAQINLSLIKPKKALIISETETGNLVAKCLEQLNFKTEIEPIKEINKELPNFIDYDIAFIYSKIFEPILTDYLKTIKTYSSLKIVAMVDNKNSLYPAKVVDEAIELEKLQDTIYDKIIKLYGSEMVTTKQTEKNNNIEKETKEAEKMANVLVADDDIANLHILEYMLKEYNLNVKTLTNGEDVLKTLETQEFDLIILDSVMPKLDGYETIQKIRENPKFNSTPIIIHTSFSIEKSSMDRIFKLGFDSYLPKPFNRYDLKSLLERYIPTFTETKRVKVKKTKKIDKESLKEFIAIYSDCDKMLDKYIKEGREEQAFALLKDLKKLSIKIDAGDFTNILDKIEKTLINKHSTDNSLLYNFSNSLKELKSNIIKQLSA